MSSGESRNLHAHGDEELCETGMALYARALREGSVHRDDGEAAPCLLDLGLLHPDMDDEKRLVPTAPTVALPRLLRTFDERIAEERRREARLAEAFEPLMRIAGSHTAVTDTPTIRVLRGKGQIDLAITEALAKASEELLAIQPHNGLASKTLGSALDRDQALLDRGARIRTLYQHPVRHTPPVIARYELLRGDVEARTLDEVTERLLVIDRAVAFVAASKDRTAALEVRTPALLTFFVTTFDRLWRLATPMHPEAAHRPSLNGVTPRQHAIAALLIEGHTDAAIADRLGLNIRTARVHIAKLAATLGSESRAQLGYLIGRSGILEPPDREP
ncbi:helix-turn-helix transcriptional regulator [Streptomyces sp. ActVer]|uniref:helix-turn-helix transcriptional regulator n=1 Tax=Streptomyces sp. ActVer TaxID=3014558 RepID=UPI0022B36424|nr:helix-turn-helix transcriptional regulator [Streptomyces sp. ActVer]MCZ4506859.1 helix-turn-helix transcriptional regulator [Streptomyces sp. ActVer]